MASVSKNTGRIFNIKRHRVFQQKNKTIKKYKFENGYNPLTEFFDPYGTEGFNEPEDGIEWSDCCVEEWIEYKMFGTIPEYYRTNKEI